MQIRSLGIRSAVAALVAVLSSGLAHAATQTTTFLVTANVSTNCTIAATDLNFGDYSPTAASPLDGQSTISVLCTNSTAWNIGLNQGIYSGATVTTRRMTGPTPYSLQYALYSDSARTVNWGNTVGTDTVSGSGTGGTQNETVYGRIPASQNVGAGGYQDTVTATVTF